MRKRRNKFWTVVFSFLPGAGHMFMGFMRKGLSLLAAFFLINALSSWLNIGELMFLLPVLWFYAFFDCINIMSAPDEQFFDAEDTCFFDTEFVREKFPSLANRYGLIMGTVLVIVGVYLLFSSTMNVFYFMDLSERATQVLYFVRRLVPTALVSALIVFFGVKLIIGKKKELKEDDEG